MASEDIEALRQDRTELLNLARLVRSIAYLGDLNLERRAMAAN